MADISIGLTGIKAAQRAFDVIGNNIANAATEGYHRQRVDLTPAYSSFRNGVLLGGGVNVTGVSRVIDTLLEQEILRQKSALEFTTQENITFASIETALGELTDNAGGLNAAMDRFFSSMADLAAHPAQPVWQNQLVSDAQSLTAQFRTLGTFLRALDTQIRFEIDNVIESINSIASRIAALNENIERLQATGGSTGNLCDQRDQAIADLARLAGVQTYERKYGVVDVTIAGMPLVMGSSTEKLVSGLTLDNAMGVAMEGSIQYRTNVEGGRLGALVSLVNGELTNLRTNLDLLAQSLVTQVNALHVQGVGSAGSFARLDGWIMPSDRLADFQGPVSDGSFCIRLTDTSTGQVTRHAITVDSANDTLADIAAAISAITGLTASDAGSRLTIIADTDYRFDFLPAVTAEPSLTSLHGASPPTISVSGVYTGSVNDTFTFTVSGTGSVGSGSLQLVVTDGSGNPVNTLNIGAGYAPGDRLDVGNGLKVALSIGDLDTAAGDYFEVDAYATSDTSGFLAAAGLNTFFTGNGAIDMSVDRHLIDTPARAAAALGPEMSDNANALAMAALKDTAVGALGHVSCSEYYRRMVTDFGHKLSLNLSRQNNIEMMVQSLMNQQSEISGVDINDQAAQLLIFEQMFQAVAKYMSTYNNSMMTLMNML
ncbi:MAG TPA: flagellar hook-associated protein FlgK [Phycisphaerales bacterium]|nr:flagellar hook-associated protein FlgK [Phycisphaerales bacterium]